MLIILHVTAVTVASPSGAPSAHAHTSPGCPCTTMRQRCPNCPMTSCRNAQSSNVWHETFFFPYTSGELPNRSNERRFLPYTHKHKQTHSYSIILQIHSYSIILQITLSVRLFCASCTDLLWKTFYNNFFGQTTYNLSTQLYVSQLLLLKYV